MPNSSLAAFLVALNLALVVLVIIWLHSPPRDYRQPPRSQADAVDAKGKAKDDKSHSDEAPSVLPLDNAQKTQNEANPAATERLQDSGGWTVSDRIALGVGVIALLQFIILVATWLIMVRTARRQLRAYVFADQGEIHNLDGPDPVRASVTIRNFGQTPAYRLTAWGGIGLGPFPPNRLPTPDRKRSRATMLPPSGSFSRIEVGRVLSEEERAVLRDGTAAIYVYGDIRYTDAFNRAQWCTYRLMFGGDAGVHITVNNKDVRVGILSVCADGNDASEG